MTKTANRYQMEITDGYAAWGEPDRPEIEAASLEDAKRQAEDYVQREGIDCGQYAPGDTMRIRLRQYNAEHDDFEDLAESWRYRLASPAGRYARHA